MNVENTEKIPSGTVASAEAITGKLYEAARHTADAQGLVATAASTFHDAESASFAPNGVVGMVPLLDLVARELHRQSSDWRAIGTARKTSRR